MTRLWAVNASPLIVLEKINQIDLLVNVPDTLVIPQGVVDELNMGPQNDSVRVWIEANGKPFIRDATLNPVIQSWDLGQGESHVLSWALANQNYVAIIDDLAARKCAQTLSVPVAGTIGVILQAKKIGVIDKIKPLLNDLKKTGFRIAPNILDTALHLAKE